MPGSSFPLSPWERAGERARKLLLTAAIPLVLAACAGPQAPPPEFYQLRLELPADAAAPRQQMPATPGAWQLMGTIRLPEYLDRDVLWLPSGSAGLQPLPGHRWAEPLREAVPRLLVHDLGRLLGAERIWRGTPPPGLVVARQLRVEILELSATADRRHVKLRARGALSDPAGQLPTQVIEIDLSVSSAGPAPDQLVAAHRTALWEMARRLAAR